MQYFLLRANSIFIPLARAHVLALHEVVQCQLGPGKIASIRSAADKLLASA